MKDVVIGVILIGVLIVAFSRFGGPEETTPTLTPEPESNSNPAWSGDAGEIRPGEGEELVVEEEPTSPATGDIYERRIYYGIFTWLITGAYAWHYLRNLRLD